jgi:hypothetical protein
MNSKLPAAPARQAKGYLSRFLIYAGLLVILSTTLWLVVKAYRLYVIYQDIAPHLAGLETQISIARQNPAGLDLEQIEHDLRATATGFDRLYEEAKPFLPVMPYLAWVPVYGEDIRSAPYLLTAVRNASKAGVILFERCSPLLQADSREDQVAFLSRTVELLTNGQGDLRQAQTLLQRSQSSLDHVHTPLLSPLIARRLAPLQAYLPEAISGLEVAQRLPSLLGADSPQTYLILAQNSDELRPTGGFISTAGHIVLEEGRIAQFVMQDSYAVDRLSQAYPYPPVPIHEYMAADYWVIRDANWSPDFPTSARTIAELYALGQGISADGIIVFDQQAVSYLLRAFEPLEVEGEQVTSQNVIKLMRRHWTPAEGQELDAWWSGRKSFMFALAQTVRRKSEPGEVGIWLTLLDALKRALAEKHILIYLQDPVAAEYLAEHNWDGSLRPVEGDYLMVADANLGFNKANALVERSLTYQISLGEGGDAQAHAKLVYQHRAEKRSDACWQQPRYDRIYEQNMQRCYWNYLRLVVPTGAQLTSGPRIVVEGRYLPRDQATTGEMDIEPMGADKVSWGQLFLLPPQESLELDYFYSLPPGTVHRTQDRWTYNLYLQKQPGTLAPTAEVAVTLPEGSQLVQSLPEPNTQNGPTITYMVSMATDQPIKIVYRQVPKEVLER